MKLVEFGLPLRKAVVPPLIALHFFRSVSADVVETLKTFVPAARADGRSATSSLICSGLSLTAPRKMTPGLGNSAETTV